MTKTAYWRLTVHFWPRAAEAGLPPVVSCGFETGEQFYRPHDLDFEHPPSREEFLAIVTQVPWMQVAWIRLLPILPRNPWPMMDKLHKLATVDLQDEMGHAIGRLEVCRQDRWLNQGYVAPCIGSEACRAVTRYLRRSREANEYLDTNQYALMERVARVTHWTEETVRSEMRAMLVEGGFLKNGKRP